VEVWAVIVAGGRGTRFGQPKQYADLAGSRVIDRAVAAARPTCDGVVVVLPGPDVGTVAVPGADVVVPGGATRSESVRAGIGAVPDGADVIVVHDAARPLAAAELWEAAVAAVVAGADAAVPGVAVIDTIKRVAHGAVVETLDRTELVAVQTPQAFRAAVLRAAHRAGGEATDDAALVEMTGGRVVVVVGDPDNLKVTRPADLDQAAALVARSTPAAGGPGR